MRGLLCERKQSPLVAGLLPVSSTATVGAPCRNFSPTGRPPEEFVLTYSEKLRDPRWQKLRLEVFQKAGFACERCGDKESTLHVHHKMYIKGREPWDYEIYFLECLCEECHSTAHEGPDELSELVMQLPNDGPGSRSEAAFIVAGLLGIGKDNAFSFLCGRTERHALLYKAGEKFSRTNKS